MKKSGQATTSTEEPAPHLTAQLSNAVALCAKQDQIVWGIFGIFWAADAVLLAALFAGDGAPKPPVDMIVSAIGAGMSLCWSLAQWRAISFLDFYDTVIHRLELKILGQRSELALSSRLNNLRVPGPSCRPIIIGSALFSLVTWLLAFYYFLWFR